VAAGKRFCGGCGQALPIVAASAQPEPVTAPGPAPQSCAQCGAALTPGKRFCKQCGQAVNSEAPAAQVETVPSGQGSSAASQGPVFDLPPAVPVAEPAEMPVPVQDKSSIDPGSAAPAEEPQVPHDAKGESAAAPTSTREQEESKGAIPTPPPAAAVSPSPSERLPELRRRARAKTGLIIGIAAVLLAAAGGVLAWHFFWHRNVSAAARAPSATQQAVVTPPAQNQIPETATAPGQSFKPLPGTPENTAANVPQPPIGSGSAAKLRSPTTSTSEGSAQHRNPATSQPKIESPPPPATPAAPRSGVLHYQGPPVPHNGTVVFDHLPQARLKFTFDHQAWSLTIKANPDGTKRVTMISQAPGYQTNCDLGWEVVE